MQTAGGRSRNWDKERKINTPQTVLSLFNHCQLIHKLRRDSQARRLKLTQSAVQEGRTWQAERYVLSQNHIFPQEEVHTRSTSEVIVRCWWLAGWNLLPPPFLSPPPTVFCFSFTSCELGTFNSHMDRQPNTLQTDSSFLFDGDRKWPFVVYFPWDNPSYSKDALVRAICFCSSLWYWDIYVITFFLLLVNTLLFIISFFAHENTRKLNWKQNKSPCHRQTWNFSLFVCVCWGHICISISLHDSIWTPLAMYILKTIQLAKSLEYIAF